MVAAILHVDVDCFYAQVEHRRNPFIDPARPLAVTQKFLVVTCNYAARRAGVAKMMRIEAAKAACPELVCVPGEDLTPYREASDTIFSALSAWGPTQKTGLDEFFVDVSAAAAQEQQQPGWAAGMHVHAASDGTTTAEQASRTGTNYRPMDLRASGGGGSSGGSSGGSAEDERLLRAASHVAASVRAAILADSGLTCSVGLSTNRLLAKLASGLHKPDGMTALPSHEGEAFVGPLPVRVLPGVGSAAAAKLRAAGVSTCAELAAAPPAEMRAALGAGAARLQGLARGLDAEPVEQSGPPKSLSVEDSFKGVNSLEGLGLVLRVLAPDLKRRVSADRASHGRSARTLVVRWRHAATGGAGRAVASRSTPMPTACAEPGEAGVTELIQSATQVLASALRPSEAAPPFTITLLALTASGFEAAAPRGGGAAAGARRAGAGSEAAAGVAAGAAEARRQQQWRSSYGGGGEAAASAALCSKAEERRRREAAHGAAHGVLSDDERGLDVPRGAGRPTEPRPLLVQAPLRLGGPRSSAVAAERGAEEAAEPEPAAAAVCSCPICGAELPPGDNAAQNAHVDACLSGPLLHAEAAGSSATAAPLPRAPTSAAGGGKRKRGGASPGQRTLAAWRT